MTDFGSRILTENSKVAIIGAGPAGLSAAKHLIEAGFENVTIYEKSDEIGGVWRFTETPEHPHATPLYESLHINLPAECMGFVDYPMKAKQGSFCSHREVFQYLKDYAVKFDVIDKVKFSSQVEKVAMVDDMWYVTVNQETNLFDFVIVAIGRYATPDFPACFSDHSFAGMIIPAAEYRRPQDWIGKKVVVIGSAQSGTDISIELLGHASHVTLIGSAPTPGISDQIDRLESEWIKEVTTSGIITTTGRQINADVIIVAAGYLYKFPFLENDVLQLDPTNRKIENLYRQIIPTSQPRLGLIGVPSFVLIFPLADYQSKWLIEVWRGNVKLPSKAEMNEQAAGREFGIGNKNNVRHFHKLGTHMFPYCDKLAEEAGFEADTRIMHTLFKHTFSIRCSIGPLEYRKIDYRVTGDDVSFKMYGAKKFELYETDLTEKTHF